MPVRTECLRILDRSHLREGNNIIQKDLNDRSLALVDHSHLFVSFFKLQSLSGTVTYDKKLMGRIFLNCTKMRNSVKQRPLL